MKLQFVAELSRLTCNILVYLQQLEIEDLVIVSWKVDGWGISLARFKLTRLESKK